MILYFSKSGKGQPLLILHGLLGSSDNWYTLAKKLENHFEVYRIDQRNHGRSPHHDEFNYAVMCDDLKEFIETQKILNPILLGHSMGGKVVMNFAVRYPELIHKIIVVDIITKPYPPHHDHIIKGLETIHLNTLQSRSEADRHLSNYVTSPDERQFLLKNLTRTEEGTFFWKINLQAIKKNKAIMSDALLYAGRFNKPALFVMGTRSNYFKSGDEQWVVSRFTQAQWCMLDAGHWVHAEKPNELVQAIIDFI